MAEAGAAAPPHTTAHTRPTSHHTRAPRLGELPALFDLPKISNRLAAILL